MAKKAQQAYRGEPPRQWPAWIWLSAGVVLGLVLSGIVLVKDWLPALRSNDAPQPNPAATAERAGDAGVAAEAQKPAGETKPKYDFYSVLPEMEVVVPDAEIAAKAQAQPTATPNPTATPEKYLLQAGSFRAAPDAEEMKAKLALLGLRAGVVAVTIDGTTWHRVRVGPYATARELDDARRTLTANGIDAIALREKQ